MSLERFYTALKYETHGDDGCGFPLVALINYKGEDEAPEDCCVNTFWHVLVPNGNYVRHFDGMWFKGDVYQRLVEAGEL